MMKSSSVPFTKLLEEDPALVWEQHGDTHEVLWGQGRFICKWLRAYNLPMTPQVAYKETIRCLVNPRRYKHQSGDTDSLRCLFRNQAATTWEGFNFSEKIVGGVVPKQYIPGVEMGV